MDPLSGIPNAKAFGILLSPAPAAIPIRRENEPAVNETAISPISITKGNVRTWDGQMSAIGE